MNSKIGQRDVAARRLDRLEVRQQRLGATRCAVDAAALLEVHQVRLGVAGRRGSRPASAIASSIAQVEPLPLVPATVTTGAPSKREAEALAHDRGHARRASGRSSSGAGARSGRASRRRVTPARAPRRRLSGHRVGALPLQHRERRATTPRSSRRSTIMSMRALAGAGTRRAGSLRAASRARCSRSRAGRQSRSAPSARRSRRRRRRRSSPTRRPSSGRSAR